MAYSRIGRGIQVGLLAGMFAAGYLVGSINQRNADAQLGDVGKAAMEKAGGAGGAVGSVTKLGSSIVEMQQHVDGLQKNIETLKQVKSALGG
jgi:hypothetical protein